MPDNILTLMTRAQLMQLRNLLTAFLDDKERIKEEFPYGRLYDYEVAAGAMYVRNFINTLIYGPEDE